MEKAYNINTNSNSNDKIKNKIKKVSFFDDIINNQNISKQKFSDRFKNNFDQINLKKRNFKSKYLNKPNEFIYKNNLLMKKDNDKFKYNFTESTNNKNINNQDKSKYNFKSINYPNNSINKNNTVNYENKPIDEMKMLIENNNNYNYNDNNICNDQYYLELIKNNYINDHIYTGKVVLDYNVEIKCFKDTIEDLKFLNNYSMVYTCWDKSIGIVKLNCNKLYLYKEIKYQNIPLKISVNYELNTILISFENGLGKFYDFELNYINSILFDDLLVNSYCYNNIFYCIKSNGKMLKINSKFKYENIEIFNEPIQNVCFDKKYTAIVFENSNLIIINLEYLFSSKDINFSLYIIENEINNSEISIIDLNIEFNIISFGYENGNIKICFLDNFYKENDFVKNISSSNKFLIHFEVKELCILYHNINSVKIINNNLILSSSSKGEIILWNFTKNIILRKIILKNYINGFEINKDYEYIAIKGGYDWFYGLDGIVNNSCLYSNKCINNIGILSLK